MPKMPDEVINLVIKYCLKNELSVLEIGDAHVACLIIGERHLSPDQLAVIVSHMMLEGVITGGLSRMNKEAATPDDLGRPN